MNRPHPGPWIHRFLVYLFSILFGVLVYWLLGFVIRDIATWPGPDYATIEQGAIDPQLNVELDDLQDRIAAARRAVTADRQRQTVLADSTSNSERTMNRLLELQKMTLQQGLTPGATEIEALGESQRLFLSNQARYQEINERISRLTEELEEMEERQRTVLNLLEEQRQPVVEAYNRQAARHRMNLAAVKLLVLIPLLGAAVAFFVKKGSGMYAPLIYGFGLAVLIRVGLVMHEHFPRRYFKYVLIGIAIVLAARVLVYLIRLRAFPKADWLLKQYREAYEHFQCPICTYPIRRGPLKFLFWNRRTLRRLQVPIDPKSAIDEPYVCPVCGIRLFEECDACHTVRHSLLPVCSRCGNEKPAALAANP